MGKSFVNISRQSIYAIYHVISQLKPYHLWENYCQLQIFAEKHFRSREEGLESHSLLEWGEIVCFLKDRIKKPLRFYLFKDLNSKELALKIFNHQKICEQKEAYYILKGDRSFPPLLELIDLCPFGLTALGKTSNLKAKPSPASTPP